jgi:hypothetical protein
VSRLTLDEAREGDALCVVSYGGGVQSTALLALAAARKIPHRTFLFCNVGDDSEHPATLRFVAAHAIPFAEAHGIAIHVLHRTKRDGTRETLMGRLTKEGSRSLPIPVRMSNGAPGTRSCTMDFKLRVVAKWLKLHGASAATPARVAIGFSLDEAHRVGGAKHQRPFEILEYPLLDMRMNRDACIREIKAAGLPVPPKSACYFCPFHRPAMWLRMREEEPDLFEKSAALEELLNRRRDVLGKDHVFLTRFNKPLREAISDHGQDKLPLLDAPDADTCDDGACWT